VDQLDLGQYEVDAGHLSPIVLVQERTSRSVRLKATEIDARHTNCSVVFDPPVTERDPVEFCFRSYDLNVFCMNLDEYRRVHSGAESGSDFLSKGVRDPVDQLTLHVRFPSAMKFASQPRFEVVSDDDEAHFHAELTAAYKPYFCYSPTLRTAVFSLEHPPVAYAYRICWNYGDVAVTRPSTAAQRVRLRRFVQRHLEIRKAVFTGVHSDSRLAANVDAVLRILASFAQSVKLEVEKRRCSREVTR
jgi:hypothetical protein